MSFELNCSCWNYILLFQYYGVFVEFPWFRSFSKYLFRYRSENENSEIRKNIYFWVYKAQMHGDLFFDHSFNFWSAITGINKKRNEFNKCRGDKSSSRTNICYIISNKAQSFRIWCRRLNSIANVFETTLAYVSIVTFLKNFRDFRVVVFGYRAKNEMSIFTENLYLLMSKAQFHLDLFFGHYFNFLSVKTEIKKRTQCH